MCDSTGGPDRRPPRWPPPIDTRATNAAESAGSLSLTVCANHQGTRLAGCAAGLKNAPWGECTETGLQGASALNALNAMQEAALRGTLFQHVSNTCTRCCAKEMCTLSRDTRPTLCADCGPGGSPKSTPFDAMRCRYNTPPFAALSPALAACHRGSAAAAFRSSLNGAATWPRPARSATLSSRSSDRIQAVTTGRLTAQRVCVESRMRTKDPKRHSRVHISLRRQHNTSKFINPS